MSPLISTATIETKIANLQAQRFPIKSNLPRMIRELGLTGATVKQDDRGFYFDGVTDITNPLFAAMPTQTEAEAHNATLPVAEVVERTAPARNIKNGACDRVREWARANPEGTKEEALAALPDINPATVKIQLRKVRLGQV